MLVENLRDQPVFVAADVKDCAITDRIGVRVCLPDLGEVAPPGSAHRFKPLLQRSLGVPVRPLIPELSEPFPADDVHPPASA